jgi:seryl-tRNA synthetase
MAGWQTTVLIFERMTTMTTDEARKILADLADTAAAAQTALTDIDQRRANLSFAAHGAADPEAKKALAKVNAERVAKLGELEEIEHARTEARQRIAAAQAHDDEAAQRRRAEQASPIAQQLAERGKKLDAAIAEYCAQFAAIGDDLDALARLGVPIPSSDLVRVNLRRAHDSATSPLDKTSRPVPPSMRKNFDSLLRGWAAPSLNWIASRLNKPAADAA